MTYYTIIYEDGIPGGHYTWEQLLPVIKTMRKFRASGCKPIGVQVVQVEGIDGSRT